jgi:sugar lactone lactonase YvrE
MADDALTPLHEGGSYFEAPRWHDGAWWVSDFYRHAVCRLDGSGGEEVVLEVEGRPSGLGWLPDGSLLVVSMADRRVLRRAPDGSVAEHADVSGLCGGPANDLVVDAAGRAYVGNFGFDLMGGADIAPTVLVRVDPDGSAHVAAGDLRFPNGMVITPDGRTLIVAETVAGRLTAFTIAADGTLGGRRAWAQVGPEPETDVLADALTRLALIPDGLALDAEGCVWAADVGRGRCVRVTEGGMLVEERRAPDGLQCFACMLGGEDGRTLLVCAAPDFAEEARMAAREGVLLSAEVDVPHAGRP